jgi:hypothetical protein
MTVPPVTAHLPNAGTTVQWNGDKSWMPVCVDDKWHDFVENVPRSNRGYNYHYCAKCGLTLYVDSSD